MVKLLPRIKLLNVRQCTAMFAPILVARADRQNLPHHRHMCTKNAAPKFRECCLVVRASTIGFTDHNAYTSTHIVHGIHSVRGTK